MASQEHMNSVRLSESKKQELLDALDGVGSVQKAPKNSREHQRIVFRLSDIALSVVHPAGGVGRFLVSSRNLSAGGMSFVHGGFLHFSTQCKIVLPTFRSEPQTIVGQVVACRHLAGKLHEIGVKFTKPIDPRQFLDAEQAAAYHDAKPMELPDLKGQVLHLDDQVSETRLLAHHVRATGVTLTSVHSPDEALEHIKKQPFDLVLCDLDLGGQKKGEDTIYAMREAEYKGPIVIITAETAYDRLQAAEDAGATHTLSKPYEPRALLSVLSECLQNVFGGGDEPIISQLGEHSDMADLIEKFIQQAKDQSAALEQMCKEDALGRVRRECMILKGAGAGHGFPIVTEAATQVLHSLDASQSIEESLADVQRLLSILKRLRISPESGNEKKAKGAEEAEDAKEAGDPKKDDDNNDTLI